MKKKKLACMFSVILAASTLLTACGSQPSEKETIDKVSETVTTTLDNENVTNSKYPEYLNLDSAYPVVKDEYADKITLSVAILMQDNASEWDDLWISQYLKEKYNINLEVDYLTSANE